MNAPSKSHSSPQPGVGLVVVGQKPNPTNKPLLNMTAAVYFDGTGNNRANVNYRIHAQQKNPKAKSVTVNGHNIKFSESYGRGYSNIAILEYMAVVAPNHVSIYLGGSGAPSGASPDQLGNAFGIGPTGLPNAVTRAIGELTKAINKKLKAKGAQLGKLRVDVFGFSRGAASARHFVARRTAKYFVNVFGPYNDLSSSLRVSPDAITINFVGLYDTVSSYGGENTGRVGADFLHYTTNVGVADTLSRINVSKGLAEALVVNGEGDYPFRNNVELLRLAIGADAKYVAQLAAGDEYRKLFPRTNIDSSVKAGHGFECVLPGSHGDVGGGYDPVMMEKYTVHGFAEHERLIREGWFTEDQLVREGTILDKRAYKYKGTRKLTRDYQYLTLHIMLMLAGKHGVEFQTTGQRSSQWSVTTSLLGLYKQMYAYVHSNLKSVGPNVFSLPVGFKSVRHNYLHLSAVQAGGDIINRGIGVILGAREVNGVPERQVIRDDAPGYKLPDHYSPRDYLVPATSLSDIAKDKIKSTYNKDVKYVKSTAKTVVDYSKATYQKDVKYVKSTAKTVVDYSKSTYNKDVNYVKSTAKTVVDYSKATYQKGAKYVKAAPNTVVKYGNNIIRNIIKKYPF